jgi:TPR repeat protein
MVDMPKTTSSTGLYEAAIGEKNQAYYLDRFEQFDEDEAGFHASWNWAALFGAGVWALYRKMYVWFFVTCAFGIILNMVMKLNPSPAVGLLYLAPGLCFAIFGNSLYHRKVKAQIANAQESNADDRKVIRRLNTSSGVHTWALYVFGAIPVIGIVAAIAIPAYQNKSKFDASTARPSVEGQSIEKSTSLKPFDGKLDAEPVNPYGQPLVTKETVDWSQFEPIKPVPEERLSDDDKNEAALALINKLEYASALKILNPLAVQGNAKAQSSLGAMYNHGHGVAQDFAEAVRWYRLAAAQGNSTAQSNLGGMYGTGDGIEKNYLRAHMWFNLAAISGNQNAVIGRNLTAKLLTPEEVAHAQSMARECQQRNFKGC